MEATKRRHFEYLAGLERKYKKYGAANAEEQAWLKCLLQDHDHQVRVFKDEVALLRECDQIAHAALVGYIAAVNSALAPIVEQAANTQSN